MAASCLNAPTGEMWQAEVATQGSNGTVGGQRLRHIARHVMHDKQHADTVM